MKLLTVSSTKTLKGEKRGYQTGIMYLLPSDSSGLGNVCPSASKGCKAACLNTAGRGKFNNVQAARMRKTKMWFEDRSSFYNILRDDIRQLIANSKRKGLIPCVRLNGTSDMPGMARRLAKEFPQVQFYDYSAIPKPWKRTLTNYHLTFSRKEDNIEECMEALDKGINVAMVFDVKNAEDLPKSYLGYEVISGEENDLRFLDKKGKKGVIVGLKAKGLAKKDTTGFVIQHAITAR